jgi:4'-phosphopantetheinyl transferase
MDSSLLAQYGVVLVRRRGERHHGAMTIADTPRRCSLAEPLHDEEIHVWKLDYRRAEGRKPLIRLLARYLAIEPSAVELNDGPHGRPALAAIHGDVLDFNWSHSGDHALVAVARGIAPGVDIERRRPRPKALEIAQRFFSSDEIAVLASAAPERRGEVFLDIWTAKEALLKAHGSGLSFGLDRLSVVGDGARIQLRRFDGEDVDAWQVQQLALGHAFVGALAWRGEARRIRLGMLASAV